MAARSGHPPGPDDATARWHNPSNPPLRRRRSTVRRATGRGSSASADGPPRTSTLHNCTPVAPTRLGSMHERMWTIPTVGTSAASLTTRLCDVHHHARRLLNPRRHSSGTGATGRRRGTVPCPAAPKDIHSPRVGQSQQRFMNDQGGKHGEVPRMRPSSFHRGIRLRRIDSRPRAPLHPRLFRERPQSVQPLPYLTPAPILLHCQGRLPSAYEGYAHDSGAIICDVIRGRNGRFGYNSRTIEWMVDGVCMAVRPRPGGFSSNGNHRASLILLVYIV